MIAGSARGRPLRAPESSRIRPTGDRVKGVMFSMLEAEAYRRGFEPRDDDDDVRFATALAWPRVLELYGGSGALAIEALSRGAERAVLVESNAAARKVIADNLLRTGLADRATVHGMPSETAVSTLSGPYDLILLDPPYDEPAVASVVERLVERGLASPSAVLIWEHARKAQPPERIGEGPGADGWRRVKTNVHGVAAVSLYVRATAE